MKVSRNWLQTYFEQPLPDVDAMAEALTFHAFEIDGIEHHGDDAVLDVKVLPDRAPYALSHLGIARELGASLGMPIKHDLLSDKPVTHEVTDQIIISIEDESVCSRYIAALVRDEDVGASPDFIKEKLESVGQRSINNVVDMTNYTMLELGQPLHVFDADKLETKDGKYHIRVRSSKEGEKITTLSGELYTLPEGILLIVDGNSEVPLAIAGVKGGNVAQVTNETKNIIIESANFDGALVRKDSQKLKLWTDASLRFQNKIAPELTAYGMDYMLGLINKFGSGELVGVAQAGQFAERKQPGVSITLEKINNMLGTDYTPAHVSNVFQALGLPYLHENDTFTVMPPFERRDIVIPEDLVEEVGRILGYEHIASVPLPPLDSTENQERYRGIERIKDFLVERGFTEISTQTFAVSGEKVLANPLDQTKPALRAGLSENMREALARATTVAPRVLGPATEVKLFEIGTIFKKDAEHLMLSIGYKQLSGKQSATLLQETISQLEDELRGVLAMKPSLSESDVVEAILTSTNLEMIGTDYEPRKITLGTYKPFSIYPFALRDIAVWTPERTEEDEVASAIIAEAGKAGLLARIDLFDRFSKEVEGKERISYAFRLVFESSERTLSDEDLNPLMEKVTNALNDKNGWEVR